MTITFNVRVEGDLLHVVTSGCHDSLDDSMKYGMSVMAEAVQKNCRRVLIDEHALEYKLATWDIYELGTQIASHMPTILRVAIVCGPQNMPDGAFFEAVVTNRGLVVKMFEDMDEAAAWLAV